ncbi:uncharacterized protein LOC144714205 [Wolffia australiana]
MDIKKSTKEIWEALKKRNVGVDRVQKAQIQGLKRDFKNLKMGRDEFIDDFSGKLSNIVVNLRSLGEDITEASFGDFETMTLDEAIGSLKVHETKIRDLQVEEEEQALLTQAIEKNKGRGEYLKNERGEHSRGCDRGCGRGRARGRGRGRGKSTNDRSNEGERKPFNKSKIQCYNFQKFGHFALECRNEKKEWTLNVAQAEGEPPTLPMAFIEEMETLLLGVGEESTNDDIWFLDTGATNHMTGKKSLFHDLQEISDGTVRFGDDSRVDIRGKGSILLETKHMEKPTSEHMTGIKRILRCIKIMGEIVGIIPMHQKEVTSGGDDVASSQSSDENLMAHRGYMAQQD